MDIVLAIGLALLGIGIVGSVKGYGIEDPVGRFLNVEVSEFGLMLIFLSLQETLVLLTFAAAAVLTVVVFMRLFLRISLIRRAEGRE